MRDAKKHAQQELFGSARRRMEDDIKMYLKTHCELTWLVII
jgi:hypothetical protein